MKKLEKKPIIATTLPVEINPFAIITAPINIIITIQNVSIKEIKFSLTALKNTFFSETD